MELRMFYQGSAVHLGSRRHYLGDGFSMACDTNG